MKYDFDQLGIIQKRSFYVSELNTILSVFGFYFDDLSTFVPDNHWYIYIFIYKIHYICIYIYIKVILVVSYVMNYPFLNLKSSFRLYSQGVCGCVFLPGKKDSPTSQMVFGGVYAFYARGTKAFAREPEEPAEEEKEKWLSWRSYAVKCAIGSINSHDISI